MSNRPEPVLPLTPDEVAAILGGVPGGNGASPARSPWTPARAGDPAFEARSRRDTILANELLDRLREVKGILDDADLAPRAAEQARDAMRRFERALMEMLRYHGT